MELAPEYQGREQALVKHDVLRRYLKRFFMILGQSNDVINYIDCFAGPWLEGTSDLSDTSVGIAISEMEECREALLKFNRNVRFRALFIEYDKDAARKLAEFLKQKNSKYIELKYINSDFASAVPDIKRWAEEVGFSFFFVDPKGWRDVDPETLRPLLSLRSSEFLINLMYDFVNRFVEDPTSQDRMRRIFGDAIKSLPTSPADRRTYLLRSYRDNVKHAFWSKEAWTSYVQIDRPGMNRVLYYLVYLTSHPKGIDVFSTEIEKSKKLQSRVHISKRIEKKSDRFCINDMFGDIDESTLINNSSSDELEPAKSFWLNHLKPEPKVFTLRDFADAIEKTDLSPTVLQKAFIALWRDGRVVNHDADVSRRKSKGIHFDKGGERVSLARQRPH